MERLTSFCLDDHIPRSILDKVAFGYYMFQIVSTICLDMQGTLPAFLYPSWVRWFHAHHVESWKDPFLANTWDHPWYFSICAWEYCLQVPFFFVAAQAYWQRIQGTEQCSWIRIPVIMYCTQTITAVSGVMMMALMEDFTRYTSPNVPSGLVERLKLACMYSLFFWFCVLHLLDALTGKAYVQRPESAVPEKKKGD